MLFINFIIFKCIVLELHLVQSVENNKNVVTESIIHHTINNLFANLKLNKTSKQTSFDQYNTLHRYFTALTLQNYENLNNIIRLTRINNKREEENLIEIINNVLEEDTNTVNKEIDLMNDSYVTNFIELFLNNLQRLKEEFNVDEGYANINSDILELLGDPKVKFTSLNVTDKEFRNSEENDVISGENEFWEPDGRRIFKGERTKIKYYPFMATVQIFNNFHCAGSIIKSDLIITAASCLQLAWNNRLFRENPAFLSARVGSSFYNGGGEVIPILEVYFYPGYNPKNLKDNLCLLRLTRHLKFRRRQRNIKKIDFDRSEFKLPPNTPGITVVGWGAKEHSPIIGSPWKNKLSDAVLDFYPLRECQEVYSRQYVSSKNFCAGFFSRGGGACNRDVGGPGISNGKLMGVISFGSPVCGMPDAPTVFTKLGYYADWIEEIMDQYVPMSKKRTTLKPLFDPLTAPPKYIPPESTTFKIEPITGRTMTPIPISQIDSQLRIIDEKVFKDFLATMFNSKEINEYKDILNDGDNTTLDFIGSIEESDKIVSEQLNLVTEPQDGLALHTSVFGGSEDTESEKYDIDTGYTVIDQENNTYVDNAGDENVDLKRIVEEEVIHDPLKIEENITNDSQQTEESLALILPEDDFNDIKIISDDKTNNEKEIGMSIPVNIFEDLTRAQEETNGVLPESVLYGLLSEVIRDEVGNISINTLFVLFVRP